MDSRQPRIVGLDAGFDVWVNPESYVSSVPGGADDNLIEGGEMKFVCKPGARNITVIFQPLLRYSEHTGSKQNAPNETDEDVVLRGGGLLALLECDLASIKTTNQSWPSDTLTLIILMEPTLLLGVFNIRTLHCLTLQMHKNRPSIWFRLQPS